MSKVEQILDINIQAVLKNIHQICELTLSKVGKRRGSSYEIEVEGDMNLKHEGISYQFDDLEQLLEIMAMEDIKDLVYFRFYINVKKKTRDGYPKTIIQTLYTTNFEYNDVVNISISKLNITDSKELIAEIARLLGARIFKPPIESEDEKLARLRKDAVKDISNILNNFQHFLARISEPFKDEKSVQNFLFPILKSHYPELQEEDYLPKFTGTASKPDFGLVKLDIAIEVKYLSSKLKFKSLSPQINDDSRQYFGDSSPMKTMIVFIYNGSGEAIPANFIEDHESTDVISSVIIAPLTLPK